MKSSKAAGRYALSLLQLSTEKGLLEAVKSDMALIATTIESNPELELMLHSPVIKQDAKQKVMEKVFSSHVNSLTLQFVALLTTKGREGMLGQIALAFVEIYNEQKGIVIAQVTTASPMTKDQRESAKNSLKTLGKTIEIKETIDPTILGGIKIKVGDLRIDASIRMKLNDLKADITKNKLSAIN